MFNFFHQFLSKYLYNGVVSRNIQPKTILVNFKNDINQDSIVINVGNLSYYNMQVVTNNEKEEKIFSLILDVKYNNGENGKIVVGNFENKKQAYIAKDVLLSKLASPSLSLIKFIFILLFVKATSDLTDL